MDGVIQYCNTDLDIWSNGDLSQLANYFDTHGLHSLHVTKTEDSSSYATFEVDGFYREPQETITAMLLIVESLPPIEADIWTACTRREFNIGYDCGNDPWAFNQALPCELLERLAKAGGTLRITLYPDRTPVS